MKPIAAIGILGLVALASTEASAYIGRSYLQVPGVAGDWKADHHTGWIRGEAHYWIKNPERAPLPADDRRPDFTLPKAPRTGAETLTIAIDKRNPALPALMAQCAAGERVPEVLFAEAAESTRKLPPEVPDYFDFKLMDVEIACPVLANAPEQAIVLNFKNIEWTNFDPKAPLTPVAAQPGKLEPAQPKGATKVFALTWYAPANTASDDQCARLNAKPTQDDYFALLSKKDAAREKAALGDKGGVGGERVSFRGPGQLNVCFLPGIVPDPGYVTPQAKVTPGLDLDGTQAGVDNHLFNIEGCIGGFQRKGVLPQVLNERRRNGSAAILVEISGIDNDRNDDHVDVAILYSKDRLVKDATGKVMLSDYTFRLAEDPEVTRYFTRMRGRIKDGVITTEPIEALNLYAIASATGSSFRDARLRLEVMPDGTMKGVIGGYQDWRRYMDSLASQNTAAINWEWSVGFQCPAVYQALKRDADGLKDPVTGEFNGISTAYDIEGVPAFIPPAQRKTQIAGTTP